MPIPAVQILAIIGVVATAGAFVLWSGGGDVEADASLEDGAGEVRVVDELPLDRGYYVRTDASCATASNATAALLQRQGLYWGSSFCTFERIEQTGPSRFRVQQACGDPRGGIAAPVPAEWVIKDRTSLSFKDSEGWEHAARLCSQRDMPAGFRETDISELIK